jgi:hypothetical protein
MDKDWIYRLELAGLIFHYINVPFVLITYDNNAKSIKDRKKQKIESKHLILRYFFKNKKYLFKLFFWPVKYYYDLIWKINVLISMKVLR